jgi:hypothetical protein
LFCFVLALLAVYKVGSCLLHSLMSLLFNCFGVPHL